VESFRMLLGTEGGVYLQVLDAQVSRDQSVRV